MEKGKGNHGDGSTSRKLSFLLNKAYQKAKRSAIRITKIRKRKSIPDGSEPSGKPACWETQITNASGSDEEPLCLNESYRLKGLAGQGGFATVYTATRVSDNKPVAIKIIQKSSVYCYEEVDGNNAPIEVFLHKDLIHQNIIRLYDFFELPNFYVLVLERPEHYKDLFDYINELRYLSENEARRIFKQVLEAVIYCDKKGVFHRDIKDENILMDLNTGAVKLFDFGSGTRLENSLYTEYEGTRAYCPPEWFRFHRYHARAATIWSLGILLYDMITGDVPFENEFEIVRAQPRYPKYISKDAQHLISLLLHKQPNERPSLEEITKHSWMRASHDHKSERKMRYSFAARPSVILNKRRGHSFSD